MRTERSAKQYEFEALGRCRVVAGFDGGNITSDGGAVLLRETDRVLGLSEQVATCFTDERNQNSVAHKLETLVARRIMALHWVMRISMIMMICAMTGRSDCCPTRLNPGATIAPCCPESRR